MGRLSVIFVMLAAIVACSREDSLSDIEHGIKYGDDVGHEMIILGDRLDNPYTTENMTKALQSLYPVKSRGELQPTHLYVRFLPLEESDFELLENLDLSDHPLDYQIIKDGDYYHDPSVDEDDATWQYAVVPHDYVFPDLHYEIIDKCFIKDDVISSRSGDIDWAEVERESYRLTGNEDMIVPQTRSGKSRPSGRITVADEKVNGGKPFGLAGVRVRCNSFVKFSHTYTDRDGYYSIPKEYSAKVRYRLVFKNEKGFAIGFNKLLVPASTAALGKHSSEGLDYTVTSSSDRRLFTRSVVNNAAYDYISRCSSEDMAVSPPPADLRIWLFKGMKASSAVMLHHGAVVDRKNINKFLGVFASILKFFAPDITIGTEGKSEYSEIYSTVCHELAHASHFSQVGTEFWNRYILFIIKAFISSGGSSYGTGNETDAGYCAVGEMWAYYMESLMYKERYGGNIPSFGSTHWFAPQIFRALDQRGISRSDILAALTPDITDVVKLKSRLISMHPEKGSMINQVFNRYR